MIRFDKIDLGAYRVAAGRPHPKKGAHRNLALGHLDPKAPPLFESQQVADAKEILDDKHEVTYANALRKWQSYVDVAGVILVSSVTHNKKDHTKLMLKALEARCMTNGSAVQISDFFNVVFGFNQGTNPEYVKAIFDRMANLVDWAHPSSKKLIMDDFRGEIIEFFTASWEQTIGLRNSTPGQDGSLCNLYPAYVDNPDTKSKDTLFTFAGIEKYGVGDSVGLTVQREDDMGRLINADEDVGMKTASSSTQVKLWKVE